MNSIDKYKLETDKFKSLFTIIIHNMLIKDIILKLKSYLRKVKIINNLYKKKYINEKITNFSVSENCWIHQIT